MEVIDELIQLAKDLDAATKRGEDMGLTDDEIALTPSLPLSRAMPIAPRCLSRSLPPAARLYDALATSDSAVQAMGDAKLKVIAAELITQVKKSVTIDWTLREGARAKIKVMVKRILNKHGYWLPRCRRSVGQRPVPGTACLSRPAPSARRTCRRRR